MIFNGLNASPTFHVGQRFMLPVKKIVPFGLFFELSPGFDALLHISRIPCGNLAAFSVGQVVATRICVIDSSGRVQLALDALPPASVATSVPCGDNSAAVWRQSHPEADAAAVAWLRSVTRTAPIHATLLAELRTRFGVPAPFAAWVRLHSDWFVNFGPVNKVSAHPCCGLASQLDNMAYWSEPIRTLPPAMPEEATAGKSLHTGTGERHEVHQRERRAEIVASRPDAVLLLDGSNLLRTLHGGGKSLAVLIRELERAGKRCFVVFDANIKFVLDETKDDAGKRILSERADCVTIVPAGSPADGYILLLADCKGYAVISNDRFEDYRDRYPWLGARVESSERRLHTVAEIGGDIVAPTLGLVAHV